MQDAALQSLRPSPGRCASTSCWCAARGVRPAAARPAGTGFANDATNASTQSSATRARARPCRRGGTCAATLPGCNGPRSMPRSAASGPFIEALPPRRKPRPPRAAAQQEGQQPGRGDHFVRPTARRMFISAVDGGHTRSVRRQGVDASSSRISQSCFSRTQLHHRRRTPRRAHHELREHGS